jgi:putative FmdB family regulatory protein
LPLYEYQCPKDGTFEKIRKFSDPPLAACPTCGGPIEKLISAPAIQFKGTGWYITDYARKSGGGESAREKGDAKERGEAAKEKGSTKDSGESAKESKDSSKRASKDSSSSSPTPTSTMPSSSTSTDKK